MKKKLATLLVFAMVVTSSITMPFASYAETTTTTAKEIKAIYGAETVVTTAPTKSEDGKTLTAEFKYTSKWNFSVKFSADRLNLVNPTITVTTEGGSVVQPNNGVYALSKGGKYTITLSYSFLIPSDEEELSLKTQAVITKLTPGTPAPLTDVQDEEKWYEIEVDPANGKATIFSILAMDNNPETKVEYKAEIFDKNNKSLGTSVWNSDFDMMFECPLMLEKDTYYVKLYPNKASGDKASFNLTATTVSAAEVDVKDDTTESLVPENTDEDITLYSFVNKNKKISGYWYKIEPTVTGGGTGRYEFSVDFGSSKYGDVAIELLDDLNFDNVLESEEYAYVGGDHNTFYADLYSGEKYYLKLTPRTGIPATKLNLKIKQHTCEDAWFVSDADGQEVSYGCSCGADDAIKAMFTLDTTVKNITYTGQDVVPTVTLVVDDWYAEEGVTVTPEDLAACYTVGLKNNKKEAIASVKNVGIYTATIKFIKDPNSNNSLEGLDSITKTFKVIPIGTTLKSVTAGKKAFTVKWEKQTTKTSGYQIQYSRSSSFKNAKTVTISKSSTTKKTVSKLTAKKKYYVRVRTYKNVKNSSDKTIKCYSAWSKYKTVTPKK